ncbi:hypothetical protein D3C81_2318700 [compost metagenome]
MWLIASHRVAVDPAGTVRVAILFADVGLPAAGTLCRSTTTTPAVPLLTTAAWMVAWVFAGAM